MSELELCCVSDEEYEPTVNDPPHLATINDAASVADFMGSLYDEFHTYAPAHGSAKVSFAQREQNGRGRRHSAEDFTHPAPSPYKAAATARLTSAASSASSSAS